MTNQSKRNLLKSAGRGSGLLLGGAAIPESWRKPMVEAVLLPAHAATTDTVDPPTTTTTTTQAPPVCTHQLFALSEGGALIESGSSDVAREQHKFTGMITPAVAGISVVVTVPPLPPLPAVLTLADGSYDTNVEIDFGSAAFVDTVSATAVAQTGDECATANWTATLAPIPTD